MGSGGDFEVFFKMVFLGPFLPLSFAVQFRRSSLIHFTLLVLLFVLFFVLRFRLDPGGTPPPDLPPDRRLAPGGQKRGF